MTLIEKVADELREARLLSHLDTAEAVTKAVLGEAASLVIHRGMLHCLSDTRDWPAHENRLKDIAAAIRALGGL